ncbi:MAG TPA: hypothetical protein VK116_14200, partial [Planctomycetota bacterium]|nr:hypothetical protein [Planctomycetota bacterium]
MIPKVLELSRREENATASRLATRPRWRSPVETRRIARSLFVAPLVLTLLVSLLGCDDDDDEIVILDQGRVIASFRTIADFLDDPTVNFLFRSMPRHPGSTPPDIASSYEATGIIIANSVP